MANVGYVDSAIYGNGNGWEWEQPNGNPMGMGICDQNGNGNGKMINGNGLEWQRIKQLLLISMLLSTVLAHNNK